MALLDCLYQFCSIIFTRIMSMISNLFIRSNTKSWNYESCINSMKFTVYFDQLSFFWYLIKSWVFLLRELWIFNYHVKSWSNNLSYENINTGVSVVFKIKCELKCQNELSLEYYFSGNTSVYFFITEIIWQTFDVIIDDP